jgi:hypothetical protein
MASLQNSMPVQAIVERRQLLEGRAVRPMESRSSAKVLGVARRSTPSSTSFW